MRVVMRIIGQVAARIISTAENNVRILCAFVAVPDYRGTRRNNIAVYRILEFTVCDGQLLKCTPAAIYNLVL